MSPKNKPINKEVIHILYYENGTLDPTFKHNEINRNIYIEKYNCIDNTKSSA